MTDSSLDDASKAITTSNATSIGEQPAVLANLALAQQIFNQSMQQQIASSQPQARSAIDVLTNDELAQSVTDLKAAVNAFAAPSGGEAPPDRPTEDCKLLELGLSVNAYGELIVPPGITIVIPGKFSKEDIMIALDASHLMIKVHKRGT